MSAAADAATIAAHALRDELASRFEIITSSVPLAGDTVELAHPANFDDLVSEADFVRDDRLPYWADLWPAARMLAERVRAERGVGRRLLELGCGMGLVSTAAALAGFDVTASDYYDDACLFAKANAWHNARRTIDVLHLDWRALPAGLGSWDVVVASDVLYEVPYAEQVAAALASVIAPAGYAIVADPGRPALPDFLTACGSLGLAVAATEFVPWSGDAQQQVIQLIVIRHHRGAGPNSAGRTEPRAR